jgi:cell division GTPase FtsZ
MADLFDKQSGDILVIGVGGMGGRAAGAGAEDASHQDSPLRARWAAAHDQPAELIATGLDKKILFDALEGPFSQQRAAQVVATRAKELKRLAAGRTIIFLAGSMGENAVRTYLPALAEGLRRLQDALICAIVCEPVSLLGDEQTLEEDAFAEIEAVCDLTVRLPAKSLIQEMENSPLSLLNVAIEKKLVAAIEALVGALCSHEEGGFSAATLRKSLHGGGRLSAGLGVAQGPEAIERAAEMALSGLDNEQGSGGVAAAMLASRELSVAETAALAGRFAALGAATPLLGVCAQGGLIEDAVCLVLARGAGRANVVSIA